MGGDQNTIKSSFGSPEESAPFDPARKLSGAAGFDPLRSAAPFFIFDEAGFPDPEQQTSRECINALSLNSPAGSPSFHEADNAR